ncbi:hypothetical protein D3C86_2111950 [compost metagenome]
MLQDKVDELDRRIRELVAFRDALKIYMGQLATIAPSPDVPCKHIEGAERGLWRLSPPEPVLGGDEKRTP